MKFKTNENLPLEASAVLRERGFDAETVWDEDLSGAEDRVIAARVKSQGRILLTLDLDFANTLKSSCCDWRSRTRLPLWPTWPGL